MNSPLDMDARVLFKACKQLVQPNDVLVKTLARKKLKHRVLVQKKFSELYDLDLSEELKNNLEPNYLSVVDALLEDSEESLVIKINKGIKNKDCLSLLDYFVVQDSISFENTHQKYSKHFSSSLESDIEEYFEDESVANILLNLMVGLGHRSTIDQQKAENDARDLAAADLHVAGSELLGGSSSILLALANGPEQFTALDRAYRKQKNTSDGLLELVQKNYTGIVVDLFKKLLDALIENRVFKYHAEFLHSNMSTENLEFLKILLYNTDVGAIESISKMYYQEYMIDLSEDILKRCTGSAVPVVLAMAQPRKQFTKKPTMEIVNAPTKRQKRIPLRAPPVLKPLSEVDLKDSPLKQPSKRVYASVVKNEGRSTNTSQTSSKPPGNKHGNVRQKTQFAQTQARVLNQAIHSNGGLKDAIVREVITSNSNGDIQEICLSYKQQFKVDLKEDIITTTNGEDYVTEIVNALLLPTKDYQVFLLKESLDSGVSGLENALFLSVLLKKKIAEQYKATKGSNLIEGVHSVGGQFAELLSRLISNEKSTVPPREQADQLLQSEKPLSLSQIQATSFHEFVAVLQEFSRLSSTSFDECVSNNFENATDLQLLLSTMKDAAVALANEVNDSSPGGIIKIICSQSKAELTNLRKSMQDIHSKNLEDIVNSTKFNEEVRDTLLKILENK